MSNAQIGARLRSLRGDTPRAVVADAVGISVSALQMYENGARVPRDQKKMALAEYYHTTVEAIFFNPEPHETCGVIPA
ncbi:MAG: helix-turn-helix transcriptional regulator [Stomatobaculum sp.]|nr:helix-turn-helix transcriptional regulator [Stomatobaculum sp.]MBR7058182.1 helix-turn-helix transcriptional regulator [Stomatobaculum sp.]